ncbi:MAG: hypothetical protein IKK24_00470 [Clostridia bacterium]|nr:hypothetical protein [Clostridia bacterium]
MMKNDLSNMVLRYYIGFEKTEERFLQLADFLKTTGIHRVILFSSCFLEESSIIPLQYYKKHAELLKPYTEKLREMGVEVGINVLNTIGHAYYADEKEFGFRRSVTIDGEKSRGCVCIRDENIVDFIKKEYKYYAALKPSVIFTDDDIRAISLGQIVCLCPKHISLISERVGKELTGKEIKEHILSSSFEKDAIKEAYFEQVKEDVIYLISEVADAVHEISPDTEIGVMTTSYPSITLDRDLKTFFDTIYDDKKVTRIRTGMDFYREGDHNNIPLAFSMPAIQREFICDSRVEIQPEIENDIYGSFYKSNSVTSMQIVWCLTNGFRNMQLNLFDLIDYPTNNFNETKEMLSDNMPFYNAINKLIPEGHTSNGVNIYVNSKSLLGRRTKGQGLIFESNWHKWLNIIGIPLSSDISKAECVFLTGDDIVLASDSEIDSILKKGAVIDLRAAEALLHRGYGKRIGVKGIKKCDALFAGERFTDSKINAPFEGFHNSYYFNSTLIGNDFVGEITYAEGAEILSNIINHNKEKVCDGVAVYENSDGERFCILPMDNNVFSHFTNVNHKRKQQLINVFEWICRKPLPVSSGNDKMCVNINCFENRNVITLFNLTSDDISTPKIKYNVKGTLKYLDASGELNILKYNKDTDYILLDKGIKALGTLIIVDERN